MLPGYVRGRNRISEVFKDASILTIRHTVVTREKSVFFTKPLIATATYVSPLAEMQIYILPKGGNILDLLHTVVMDLIRLHPAAWTFMLPTREFNLDMA